jgi:hypothetical protein
MVPSLPIKGLPSGLPVMCDWIPFSNQMNIDTYPLPV